ncbi:LytTR family transcriptional regulator DNA-binding domain-containing protein [Adhaeribacter swui]|uniref:LytTR family transcriptional regulator DNA-binding domain-containing protein n=1 Tax=Adhaeribacter swui TaxID=2086471 RepID=A0A7G7GBE4_9BACT|nr:LytTR family DNA-binding domain-containing protein [Adhaeribacter swui]QNF34478.1 LytTR family transcriptional regulator DNA-binding domain-containing protein [Adhaeribacter swui]
MPDTTVGRPRPVYRDTWVKIIGIPAITGFAYYLTYDHVEFNGWFIYEIFSDALKIFLVWQVVFYLITTLDKVLPWPQQLIKRLLVQTLVTAIGGIMALSILVFLDYAFIRPYQINHYWSLDVVIALIFILFINGIYAALYFYDSYVTSVAEKANLEQSLEIKVEQIKEELKAEDFFTSAREQLLVKVGRKEILVPYPDITCLYSEAKETYVLTHDNKTYLLDLSLDRLAEQLPDSRFFRANRKCIITPELIRSITTETHGKLTVHLQPKPQLPATLSISRDKAPAFRRWLKR